MKKNIIVILIGVTIGCGYVIKDNKPIYLRIVKKWAKPILKDYRLPNKNDIKGYWIECERDKKKAAYWTSGDFNGDEVTDYAFFLLRKDSKGYGVFAMVSNKNNYEIKTLRNENDFSYSYEGIETVSPGKYLTVYGKGYFEPDSTEPDTVNLINSSINWYKCESANAFYYWDKTNNTFKEVWISD